MPKTAELGEKVGIAEEGHPRGLYVLFGSEMWERFSYYGMRSLLVLYLTQRLGYSRKDALGLYATYTGLVYLTPLLGGPLADRYLGQRKAILIGGLLMTLGHFAMAFESHLYMALGLIILGNGFFKANVSTMVGQLYAPGDSRKDSAYTIFYMGINLGAFVSPLVCGWLGKNPNFGEHYGFGVAGAGMLIALLTFMTMQRTLGNQGYPPGRDPSIARLTALDYIHVIALTLLGVISIYAALTPAAKIAQAGGNNGRLLVLAYWVLLALVYAAFTALLCRVAQGQVGGAGLKDQGDIAEVITKSPFGRADWERLAVILVVSLFSIVFWMGFEQAGGTLTLFAEEKTNRVLIGEKPFPAAWYQSVDPLLIIAIAPLMSLLWNRLDRTKFSLNPVAKMGLGFVLLGIGMAVMATADGLASKSRVGPWWLVVVYFFFTVGELCLSPIGLSLINNLAHPKVASLMMAIWFLCTAAANYLAGTLEHMLEGSKINLWHFLTFASVVPGVILLALIPLLKKLGHGRL